MNEPKRPVSLTTIFLFVALALSFGFEVYKQSKRSHGVGPEDNIRLSSPSVDPAASITVSGVEIDPRWQLIYGNDEYGRGFTLTNHVVARFKFGDRGDYEAFIFPMTEEQVRSLGALGWVIDTNCYQVEFNRVTNK